MAESNSTIRITTIILLIGEASGVFAGFCPSWFTVASPFFHEQEAKSGNVKRIRAGEAAATAIVLATGLVVDDGIVVTENIFKKIESGMDKWQAAFEGTREIF